jgi:hypothetical protein
MAIDQAAIGNWIVAGDYGAQLQLGVHTLGFTRLEKASRSIEAAQKGRRGTKATCLCTPQAADEAQMQHPHFLEIARSG